jgi:hypothetical protein
MERNEMNRPYKHLLDTDLVALANKILAYEYNWREAKELNDIRKEQACRRKT